MRAVGAGARPRRRGRGRSLSGIEIADPGTPWAALAVHRWRDRGRRADRAPAAVARRAPDLVRLHGRARPSRRRWRTPRSVLVVAVLATFLVRSEPDVGRRPARAVRSSGSSKVSRRSLVYHGMADALGAPSTAKRAASRCAAAADRRRSSSPSSPACSASARRRSRFHGRMADLALVTSATLMAISAMGVDGSGGMGLWGPAVFTIPLLAAWYSYEHLDGHPPHVRPDDPRARRRAGARWHGARRSRRARRRPRGRHGRDA